MIKHKRVRLDVNCNLCGKPAAWDTPVPSQGGVWAHLCEEDAARLIPEGPPPMAYRLVRGWEEEQ